MIEKQLKYERKIHQASRETINKQAPADWWRG
jgi:hypothetical protein